MPNCNDNHNIMLLRKCRSLVHAYGRTVTHTHTHAHAYAHAHAHAHARVELHVFSLEWQNWNLITHTIKRHKLHTDIQSILSKNVDVYA